MQQNVAVDNVLTVAETFGKSCVPRIKQIIKEHRRELGTIRSNEDKARNAIYKTALSLVDKELMFMIFKGAYTENRKKALSDIILFNERVLSLTDGKKHGEYMTFQERILRAKAVPVDTLLKFNRGSFAHCIWHEERTPSMHLRRDRNSVHCFSCGKNGDSIDVVKVLRRCNTQEAVTTLIGV